MSGMSRNGLIEQLQPLELDWGDEEDCVAVVDLLCQAFTPQEAFTFMFFHCPWFGCAPIYAIEQGRAREVFVAVRAMIADGRVAGATT